MNHDLIMMIAEVVVAIIAALVTKYVVPWIKQSIDERKLDEIKKWVKEAVHAADQIMSAEQTEEKKQFVVDFIVKVMEEKGVTVISDNELNILIESAVKQIRLQQGQTTK